MQYEKDYDGQVRFALIFKDGNYVFLYRILLSLDRGTVRPCRYNKLPTRKQGL